MKMIELSARNTQKDIILDCFRLSGYDKLVSERKAYNLFNKIVDDGWLNKNIEEAIEKPIQLIYLNLTQACNFSCPYCYKGNAHKAKYMDMSTYCDIISKVSSINSECHFVITGGEPLMHPLFVEFIDFLEKRKNSYSILTNGSLLKNEIARLLSKCKYLKRVQVSLDGFTPEVHKITRGNTYNEVIKGIKTLIAHKIPFSIAPTVHDFNVQEIYDIAKFAFNHNGDIAPNNLRYVPENKMKSLSLSPENLIKSLNLIKKARMEVKSYNLKGNELKCKESDVYNNEKHLVCGLGNTVFDIDVNGDIYPCHVLSRKEFKLGNILVNNFDEITKKVASLKIRSKSTEIEKCSTCHFVTTCHAGCRADSYFYHNSFDKPDSLCETLYKFQLNNIILLRTGNNIKDKDYSII
ncbi:radical SAM/SPASM domain-containing protein [Paludibacter propionicigenes]|nr:radical SAM protein [Paludibacter propionicigenes]